MLDYTAIARCSRCNVISLPIHAVQSDPTHASVSLPHDWMGVRVFLDGEEDFTLCPDCRIEAWDWLTTRIERKPTSDGKCLSVLGWGEWRDFCDLPKGHDGDHRPPSREKCGHPLRWNGPGSHPCVRPKGHDGEHTRFGGLY